VRHGATEWNASKRFQGHSDVELSAEGRLQARAVAVFLGDGVERIYTSDLLRASETARAIANRCGAAMWLDDRLREFHFGEWEGLTWDEIVATRPHLSERGGKDAKNYAPEGGETFEALCKRVGAVFDDIAQLPFERVAVVTHAGPLHAALSVLGIGEEGEDLKAVFAPGSVTKIAMEDGKARIISLNDVRHLDPAG
jgi:broad specificity phosphatase PhoE